MPWDEGLVNSLVYDEPDPQGGRVLSYAQALNEALSLALCESQSVMVLGQGVDDPSAMFGSTKGLQERHGEQRVFDTPLSEEGMMGVCVGAAMRGLRPVYMHNRPDFILLAFNQLITHASKCHFMDNGVTKVPLVVWAAIGRGWGSGAQHSQAIQGLLIGVPGLKIAMPSTPYDAKGIMLSAISDNSPTLIFEHRWLMRKNGYVPEGKYVVPLGKGVCRKRGSDITIVGASHAIELAYQASKELLEEGVDAEIIDLRSIQPIDDQIIEASVKKTGRLLVVDTGWAIGGVCAEIGFRITETCFSVLKGPARRIGLPDTPTPAGFALEQYFYPEQSDIVKVVKEMCEK